MIKPTVGRVVWYYPAGRKHTEQPCAVLIAHVNSDDDINVGGFDSNGVPLSARHVPLIQDPTSYGDPGGGHWACWLPHQHEQATKAAVDANAVAANAAARRQAKDKA